MAVEGAGHTAEINFDATSRYFFTRTLSGVHDTLEGGSTPKESLDAWCRALTQWESRTTEERARGQLGRFYDDL